MAAWLVALGAKEMAATLPLLLLMTDALLGRPSGWWRPRRLAMRYGPLAAAAVAYVAHRWSVFGKLSYEAANQYFQGAPLSVRVPTMLKVAAAYVGRLIFPVNLNADWVVAHASGLTDGALPLLALALLVGLVGLAWAVRRTAPPVAWGILWAGLALLPVSNLVPFGALAAERFLYTSSVGACVALAWVMTRGTKSLTKASPRAPIFLAWALGCAVLVLFAVNTIDRNRDWANGLVLWEKTARQLPKSARAQHNLRHELWNQMSRSVDPEAIQKRVLAIRERVLGPDHLAVAEILNYAAVFYNSRGQYAKAEPLHKRALRIREKALGPDHPNVSQSLNNLGELYLAQGKYAEAEPLYKRALGILEKTVPNHPNLATSLDNLAELYIKMGRDDEAIRLFDRAKRIRASQ